MAEARKTNTKSDKHKQALEELEEPIGWTIVRYSTSGVFLIGQGSGHAEYPTCPVRLCRTTFSTPPLSLRAQKMPQPAKKAGIIACFACG
jgi:hypothetical protein